MITQVKLMWRSDIQTERQVVVQIRCPTIQTSSSSHTVVGPQHTNTLLDGEMVVDTDANGGQRRRFLAYDMMTLNDRLVTGYDFEVSPPCMVVTGDYRAFPSLQGAKRCGVHAAGLGRPWGYARVGP